MQRVAVTVAVAVAVVLAVTCATTTTSTPLPQFSSKPPPNTHIDMLDGSVSITVYNTGSANLTVWQNSTWLPTTWFTTDSGLPIIDLPSASASPATIVLRCAPHPSAGMAINSEVLLLATNDITRPIVAYELVCSGGAATPVTPHSMLLAPMVEQVPIRVPPPPIVPTSLPPNRPSSADQPTVMPLAVMHTIDVSMALAAQVGTANVTVTSTRTQDVLVSVSTVSAHDLPNHEHFVVGPPDVQQVVDVMSTSSVHVRSAIVNVQIQDDTGVVCPMRARSTEPTPATSVVVVVVVASCH
jgi:hypothetical protein